MQHRNSSAPSVLGKPWLEVTQLRSDLYRLRLGGVFPPGFLSNLCRALSTRHLSIEQAHAVRVPGRGFNGELYVRRLAGAVDPRQIPLLELAIQPALGLVGEGLVLQHVQVNEALAHGGSLHAVVCGQDCLGLLARLLRRLEQLGLEPVEMHVETRSGQVEDSFWLVQSGGTAALPELRDALFRALSALSTPQE